MAAMAAIVPLLTTLSLSTDLAPAPGIPPGQHASDRRTTDVSIKTCARSKLRLFKQAAKGKLRQGAHLKMVSRPAQCPVIEISDDDSEDEVPYLQRPRAPTHTLGRSENRYDEGEDEGEFGRRQRLPTHTAPSRGPPPGDGDNEADSEDNSLDINSSDSDSSPHTNRRTLLHQRRRRHHKAGNSTISPATSSVDSDLMLNPPRTRRASQRPQPPTSSVSSDKDAGNVTAPLTAPQPAPAHAPSKRAFQDVHNDNRAAYKADLCPYYYDQKLDAKMYRGEGYEKFPVVLGTVEGHKEICDQWHAQTASEALSQDTYSTGTTPSFVPARSIQGMAVENNCLRAVLEVFPEIEHEFVRNLYRQGYSDAIAEDIVGTVSAALIADIAESEAYPRQKNSKRKASSVARDETGVTIAWNKDLPKNDDYCREAIILLATAFEHIPSLYISKIVKEKQSLFDAFGFLAEKDNFCDAAVGERPYKRLRRPRPNLERKYQRKNVAHRDDHLYFNMVNELQAARQHQAREAARIKRQKAADDFESKNLALHIAQESMVECQCCFDDKPINRVVACEGEEAHFFCNDCVMRQAESQIGALKYEMLCMDTSGCRAKLSTEGIARALPLQLFDKLAFNQQQAEISLANIQGLEMCPFCDFKAICEPMEVDSIFDCQNPDCGLVTCRKCKERSHLPKTCQEVKKDKGLGARHTVEEARSEAMMRTCPKCKVKLIKEYGCNKMVCTNCNAVMCYVCQKDISGTGKEQGYDHFHRAGAICALHDQTGIDRHEAEANAAEVAAIEKAKAEYEDIDEKALRIGTAQNQKGSTAARPPAVPPAPQIRGIPNAPFVPGANAPPFPAMPQLPVGPQRDPALLFGQMPPVLQPNPQHVVPPGRGQLPGHIPQELNQMRLFEQQRHHPPNRQAGPALPLDYGMQQRQALQEFLRQRRRNPV